ncbi:MAG: nucleoside deaminase [Gemmatimonadetes bacterium]|nr:nucleoside deaminase [Gemmatimonadota bacterium]
MAYALREAKKAAEEGEVPVGAVITFEGQIIGRGHNRTEALNDPTAHAEILAIGAAAEALGDWRLHGATLYVTLEPCFMCAGAIVLARIGRLVFGATDPRAGACVSLADVTNDPRLAHQVEVVHGIGANEAVHVLQEFFAKRRKREEDKGLN